MTEEKSIDIQRDSKGRFIKGRWKKGESGNPAGRPPKNLSITSLVKELLETEDATGKTNAELIAEAIIELAKKKDLPAIRELLDRIEGKVTEKRMISSMIVHVGDEYAQKGLEMNRKDLEERQKRLLEKDTAREVPKPLTEGKEQ